MQSAPPLLSTLARHVAVRPVTPLICAISSGRVSMPANSRSRRHGRGPMILAGSRSSGRGSLRLPAKS